MKLSVWAKRKGISYRTAWRWYKEGKLPVYAEQMPTGTIVVRDEDESPINTKAVALYARVSSQDQKKDLDAQIGRLASFAAQHRMTVSTVVTEIGSGLNGHRAKLIKLLSNKNISAIIVEHKDRLMRFGFEYVEAALKAQDRNIIVPETSSGQAIDPSEMKDDLVQDMIDVLTSFCARLYGKKSARNRAQKAVLALSEAKTIKAINE